MQESPVGYSPPRLTLSPGPLRLQPFFQPAEISTARFALVPTFVKKFDAPTFLRYHSLSDNVPLRSQHNTYGSVAPRLSATELLRQLSPHLQCPTLARHIAFATIASLAPSESHHSDLSLHVSSKFSERLNIPKPLRTSQQSAPPLQHCSAPTRKQIFSTSRHHDITSRKTLID